MSLRIAPLEALFCTTTEQLVALSDCNHGAAAVATSNLHIDTVTIFGHPVIIVKGKSLL